MNNSLTLDSPTASRATPVPGGVGHLSFVYTHGVYHGSWAFSQLHPLLAVYADKQYLIDLRGHYGDRRVHPEDNIGYTEYMRDLYTELDRIPGQKLLVGHSLGGLLSMSALSRDDVVGAVLLATPLPAVIKNKRWNLLFRYPIKSLAMIIQRDAAHLYHDEVWARRYLFSATTPSDIFDVAFDRIRLQNEPFQLFDDINELVIEDTDMSKPVMVIAGSEDPTVDEDAAKMLAERFNVIPLVIQGAGHDLMLEPEYAEQLMQKIAFWLNDQGL